MKNKRHIIWILSDYILISLGFFIISGFMFLGFNSFEANIINFKIAIVSVIFFTGLSLSFSNLKDIFIRFVFGLSIVVVLLILSVGFFEMPLMKILEYHNDKWVEFVKLGFGFGILIRCLNFIMFVFKKYMGYF